MDIKKELLNYFGEEKILFNELMKNHTTFKIGGPAKYFLEASTIEDIKFALKLCDENKVEVFVMGNGSNLLARDEGYKGMIIKIGKNFNKVEVIDEDKIRANSGILLSELARFAGKNNLSGLEFSSGIPGALGGGIFMNAGAYDGEMKNIVKEVTLMDRKTYEVITYNNKEMKFDYRTSRAQTEHLIVLTVVMQLEKGNSRDISAKMKDLNQRRRDKQPLEYPSAGSTFKRPAGYYAGKLIMDSGLKGKKIGGAQVSEKHAGFVINSDEATCEDVLGLIEYIKDTVNTKFGVMLHEELRVLGKGL